MSAEASQAKREVITLTTPKKTASLKIDKEFKNTQFHGLIGYVSDVVDKYCDGHSNLSPVYVLKFFKEFKDQKDNVSSLLFDLVDIRSRIHPDSESLFGLNKVTGAISQVRRVFINNKYFIHKYLINREFMKREIIELSDFKRIDSKDEAGKDIVYYAWATSVITNEVEIYKILNKWNARNNVFDSRAAGMYTFEYLVPVEESAEEEVEEEQIPAPVQIPAKRSAPRTSKK